MMIMDVGMYNNQQNYSGECYQQGAGYQAAYDGYHDGYYDPAGYYEPLIHGHAHDAAPVISTDTGLCYTNLDYGDQQASAYNLPPPAPPHHDTFKHREEDHLDHKLDNHYVDTKYNMHFVDEAQYGHGSPLVCGDFDSYPKDFGELRDGFPREEVQAQHVQAHATHAAVPTYKWMQVKRNIPKPAGE